MNGERTPNITTRSLDTVLAALDALPEEINPAITLAFELHTLKDNHALDITTLIRRADEIEAAKESGRQDIRRVNLTGEVLEKLKPQPKRGRPPAGF